MEKYKNSDNNQSNNNKNKRWEKTSMLKAGL